MPELGPYGSNGMDRPRSIGASVDEERIISTCLHPAEVSLGSRMIVTRRAPFAVKPSPSAHR
jgi:hypothetical protein